MQLDIVPPYPTSKDIAVNEQTVSTENCFLQSVKVGKYIIRLIALAPLY